MDIGIFVTQLVLGAATLLVNPAAPGYVVLILVLIFGVTAALYWRRVTRQKAALVWFTEIVSEPKDAIDFTAKINDLNEKVDKGKEDPARQDIVSAWKEYRETLLVHGSGQNEVLRNSVRPSTFLNLEDLQMGPGFWRIVPGLFVSAGLFLTFLGLVAALSQTEQLLNTATGDAQEG